MANDPVKSSAQKRWTLNWKRYKATRVHFRLVVTFVRQIRSTKRNRQRKNTLSSKRVLFYNVSQSNCPELFLKSQENEWTFVGMNGYLGNLRRNKRWTNSVNRLDASCTRQWEKEKTSLRNFALTLPFLFWCILKQVPSCFIFIHLRPFSNTWLCCK